MSSHHPYYRRQPTPPQNEGDYTGDGTHVDLSRAHLEPYGTLEPVAAAGALFDRRSAAVIRASAALDGVDPLGPVRLFPSIAWQTQTRTTFKPSVVDIVAGLPPFGNLEIDRRSVPAMPWFFGRDLLELKWYDGSAPSIYLVRSKCLSAMAYLDYFPAHPEKGRYLRALVSAAVLAASPGWCGTFGPAIDDAYDLAVRDSEGNYDMTQMSLLVMAYRYYDALSPDAREYLITQLLARGIAHRAGLDDVFTSGGVPADWDAAAQGVGETENHILMILTTRYLTNQLLYPRTGNLLHDNRRNGGDDRPSCLSLVLTMLRGFLAADFSEYNAKDYQEETRWALLNLCTYAYDHEVRLAARMVLDYVAAHVAVSSNDLRRMVPFRRRSEGKNVNEVDGVMDVGLLAWERGADPLTPYLAMQAGNVRAYQTPSALQDAPRWWPWGIRGGGNDLAMEVLTGYRLPPSIHDLFVNDLDRRFFQRLNRVDPPSRIIGGDLGDSAEIYASSPSYLITAGGKPATWAVDPRFDGIVLGSNDQQVGVAVTTSFMSTGQSAGPAAEFDTGLLHVRSDSPTDASWGLIQFGAFSRVVGEARNYGVAPDFACGHRTYLPPWVLNGRDSPGYLYVGDDGTVRQRPEPPGFIFVDKGSRGNEPGFYLAIYQEQANGFGLLEAFDTWFHPHASFEEFKAGVLGENGTIHVRNNEPGYYRTRNGNVLHFVVWHDVARSLATSGAEVLDVSYGSADPQDAYGDAGNVRTNSFVFLRGTVLNSPEEAIVEITNVFLGWKIRLDMSDPEHPRRTSDFITPPPDTASLHTRPPRETEEAGSHHEVWLDFDWDGPSQGDVCQPFNSLSAATAGVADGGTVRIIPGSTGDRSALGGKRMKLDAPAGAVTIGGSPHGRQEVDESGGDHGVWVDFDWTGPVALRSHGDVLWPFDNLPEATIAVAAGGLITIAPGSTSDRSPIGWNKRMTLSAPLGHVIIGRVPPSISQFPSGIKPQ